MIGARHADGSITSNGGGSSSLVIVGRRPLQPRGLKIADSAEWKRIHQHALSIIATDLPSEKRDGARPVSQRGRLIDSAAGPAHNQSRSLERRFHLHPKFTTHRANWTD